MLPLQFGLDLGEGEKDPADFRDCVVLADKLGYDCAWLGDHFMPWVHSDDRSAFVWSVLGSALEASKKIKAGPYVTTPIGGRYHPALVAQAAATLDSMYPGRLVLGVGTGEAMNEAPFYGGRWPPWRERMDRLVEGVALMRKLWTSPEYLDFDSRYFSARKVFLYTKPKTSPQVLFSAVGPKAAAIAGRFGDGLITLSSRNALPELKERVLKNFDAAARAAGKNPDGMPKVLSLSFTLDDREAYVRKRKGKAGNLARGALDEPDPRVIERMGRELPAEVIAKATNFCSKWSDVIELVSRYREAGFSQIVLNTGADRELIEEYARKILSEFGSVAK